MFRRVFILRISRYFQFFLTQDSRTGINMLFSHVKRENSKQANNFTIFRFPVDVPNDCRVSETQKFMCFHHFAVKINFFLLVVVFTRRVYSFQDSYSVIIKF